MTTQPDTIGQPEPVNSAAAKTSFLAKFRIGRRMGVLTMLALAGFAGLAGTYLFGDIKIDTANEEATKLLEMEELVAEINVGALQMRRREKDFILRRDMKYAEKYRDNANLVAEELEKLAASHHSRLIESQLAVAAEGLPRHIAEFEKLISLNEKLGFDENSGLQGSLRKAVKEAETKLAEFDLDDLTVKMLMMRRHEKDFIMRGDDKYAARIDKRREEFNRLLAMAPVSEIDKLEISGLLDKYVADFHAYAETYQVEKASRKSLSTIYSEFAPALGEIYEIIEVKRDATLMEFNEVREETRVLILTIAIGIFFLFGVLSLWLTRSITTPIGLMTKAMAALADGDNRVDIPATGNRDEIGDMAGAMQVFKDNALEKVRLEEEQAAAQQRGEEEKRQAMNELADRFERQVKEVVDGVSSSATEMQATAQQMSSTAEETTRQSASVASASNQATANVQTVAATAEELSASIAEIGRQVMQSAKIAQNAVEEAESTNETVKGLAEAAAKIGDVVNLINDIAGQTNLLALNATIEAARAGEAGKGFAVVAQEVKNLANQTAKATEEISSQISAVQEETNDAVVAIEKIRGIIGEVNDIATTISSAVEEQGVSTQEIARNVQQAASGTQDVNSNIENVSRAAGETGTAAGQVLNAAREMSSQAEGLRGEVDRFLGEVRAA